jgi:hypothetical protein
MTQTRLGPCGAVAALCLAACSNDDMLRLEPTSVALTEGAAPVYDDGELTIYEAKTGLMLPILAPSDEELATLSQQAPDPFEREPWITSGDVRVQVNWTLSNLDPGGHSIWVMIDPWNEFGRYEPAIHVSDDEAVRDFSGIDMLFDLPGVEEDSPTGGSGPRLHGTFTYDDMDELAGDFATVFKILSSVVPDEDTEEDPRATLVNHAFNVRDRSYNSPLLAPYRPAVVPGLVGFDFGVRSFEPANVALEVVVEIDDSNGERVWERGQRAVLLEPPGEVVTVP